MRIRDKYLINKNSLRISKKFTQFSKDIFIQKNLNFRKEQINNKYFSCWLSLFFFYFYYSFNGHRLEPNYISSNILWVKTIFHQIFGSIDLVTMLYSRGQFDFSSTNYFPTKKEGQQQTLNQPYQTILPQTEKILTVQFSKQLS